MVQRINVALPRPLVKGQRQHEGSVIHGLTAPIQVSTLRSGLRSQVTLGRPRHPSEPPQ